MSLEPDVPDRPEPKIHPHPAIGPGGLTVGRDTHQAKRVLNYAELAVTTNFTFLTGASHPEEMVATAAALGHTAAAICDVNTLAGIVRAHVAAREHQIPLAIGTRLRLLDAPGVDLLLYPGERAAYARLCRLLTLGKRRTVKGYLRLRLDDVLDHVRDVNMQVLVIPPGDLRSRQNHVHVQSMLRVLVRCREAGLTSRSSDALSLAVCPLYDGSEARAHRQRVRSLGHHLQIPLAAVNDAQYHTPERRPLQDVLTCIRAGCSLDEAGYLLHANAERRLKSPTEMASLFADLPAAPARAAAIAARASQFSLDELKYEYPDEIHPPGVSSFDYLVDRTWAGARWRYPKGVPGRVRDQIEHEFTLIEDLQYAPYFLTVYDIVQFAQERNILCQGRGAAANSAVCYCLGITSVDPEHFDLLVERFISHERNEPPDIDVDFEHERREEVIQYIYRKYGRDRAALTAEVVSYRGRSAIREVGKALGLSLDLVDRLAKNLDWWDRDVGSEERWHEQGIDPHDPIIRRLVSLASEILGFPRHLSQHVGGFVITRSPLCELVPIENASMEDRTIIEWDKDDIDAMGMLKIDLLCLGMLTCIHKSFELLEQHEQLQLSLATVPADDSATYDMICEADTVGVFQIESRAQMSMLPRLKPRCYYDLVIEVAIVRPGPIQGEMVHPYLRRRNGEEPVEFPDDRVRRVLGKTLGVPLFQEQAMSLAIVAGGFTAGQAERLRRAMAGWRRDPTRLMELGGRLMQGMIERGYTPEYARQCYNQLKGFSEYGFPESHAASFALLAYVSSWLKCHYPAAFAVALINSQPMGFYAPAQIIRDAREHGVPVRPVDVLHSAW
ncbi:MAG: error-prone DNA polymerase, partial [Planctomycetota bacterium]